MMDPLSGLNRGYAFVTFCSKEAAQEAVKLVRTPVHLQNRFSTLKRAEWELGSRFRAGCCMVELFPSMMG